MNQQEAAAMTLEDAAKLPWDHEGMVFTRGRHYFAMFSAPLLRADFCGLIWKFQDRPDVILTSRLRLHVSTHNAWDGQDPKRWYIRKTETDTEARDAVTRTVRELPFCGAIDWIEIGGDFGKAHDIIMANPPKWMHMRTVHKESAGKRVETQIKGEEPGQ